MFGRQNEQKLTYKVDLDTQGMQQQMQQMQFQQQSMMAGSMMGGGMNPYANQEALRNFAMAQEAQQMANMDYASMTFRERAGLAITRTLTQGMAIAGGALAVGAAMVEAPILPFTGDAIVMGGEMATGKNFYPSAIIGATTANMIEGTVSGASEAFRYKHALNIAEGHNLLGGSASNSFKNNLSIYAGDLASYHNLNPDQMTSVLTAAIDNNLVNPQDLEQTKENVFKLTRSLTASTKVLYESLAMVDKTIQDFKQYSIFNSKPESMVETATFLKSISNLTGHSVDQLLQTTEALSNAFISGTSLNAGTMAPIIARGIGNAYVGMDMLNDRSQQLIRNSGGIDSLHGRFLAQAQQAGVNNPSIFSHLVGLYQYATGGSWEEGMQSAQDRMVAEYGRGNAVGASYVRESMAKMLADPAAMSQMIHADVTRNYTNLIQSGSLTYQEAFSLSMQNNLGIDAGTSEVYSGVLMRATSSRVEHENALKNRMARNAEIEAANYKRDGGGAIELGRAFGRWAADFFMGDPNDKSAWFGTHKLPELSFKDMTEEDQRNLVRMYRLDDQLADKLEGKDKREYEENLTLLMSSKISDILLGAENMGDFFLSKGFSLGEVEAPSALIDKYQKRQDVLSNLANVVEDLGTGNLTGVEVANIKDITKKWVKDYWGYGEYSFLKKEVKYDRLRKQLENSNYSSNEVEALINSIQEKQDTWFTDTESRPIGTINPSLSENYTFEEENKAIDKASKKVSEVIDKHFSTPDNIALDRVISHIFDNEREYKYAGTVGGPNAGSLRGILRRYVPSLRSAGKSDEEIEKFLNTGKIRLNSDQFGVLSGTDRESLFFGEKIKGTSEQAMLGSGRNFINLSDIDNSFDVMESLTEVDFNRLEHYAQKKEIEVDFTKLKNLVEKYNSEEDPNAQKRILIEIAEALNALPYDEKEIISKKLGINDAVVQYVLKFKNFMEGIDTQDVPTAIESMSIMQRALVNIAKAGDQSLKVTGTNLTVGDILNNTRHSDKIQDLVKFTLKRVTSSELFDAMQNVSGESYTEDEQKKLEEGTRSSIEDSFESLGKTLPDVADGFVRLAESMANPWWKKVFG